jgi:hypothetical protein
MSAGLTQDKCPVARAGMSGVQREDWWGLCHARRPLDKMVLQPLIR